MDNHLKKIFFELLQIGLWRKGKLSIETPLDNEQWEKLFLKAQHHTVEGIIFDSFNEIDPKYLPTRQIYLKWLVRVDQIEKSNLLTNTVLGELYELFKSNGLNPILQKGQGTASLYPNPIHRVCGDIDFYFNKHEYKKAIVILKKLNIEIEYKPAFSIEYTYKGIIIEHHENLFDIRDPFKHRYLENLRLKYNDSMQELPIDNQKISILNKELQLFQVNSHILKHLVGFGIGLRQICDSAILYNNYTDTINIDLLHEIYKKAGILKWSHKLHYILYFHLGLDKDKIPFSLPVNLNGEDMMNEIWESGTFGFYDERFKNGRISIISKLPDGIKRLWLNSSRYFKDAPLEVIFFPLVQLYSMIIKKKNNLK